MKIRLIEIYMIIALLFFSCDNVKNKKENQHIDDKQLELSLEEMNRKMLQYESELIDNYIEKNNLKVIKTGTGLRYQIFNEGDGNLIKKGDVVTLEYELSLLSGELLYSSENDGNKVFLVSRGGVETGLEEAVLKLKNNSEAILILPSHLAHGLLGDGNKIPPKAILVYKIKVIDIK
jgi:FKBP-type peptidyl-prolyl cis-trans isomerase